MVATRFTAAFTVLQWGGFTFKERLFIAMTWIPKARLRPCCALHPVAAFEATDGQTGQTSAELKLHLLSLCPVELRYEQLCSRSPTSPTACLQSADLSAQAAEPLHCLVQATIQGALGSLPLTLIQVQHPKAGFTVSQSCTAGLTSQRLHGAVTLVAADIICADQPLVASACKLEAASAMHGRCGAQCAMSYSHTAPLLQARDKHDRNYAQLETYGNNILHATAFSIIIAAPIGLLVIALVGPLWLTKVSSTAPSEHSQSCMCKLIAQLVCVPVWVLCLCMQHRCPEQQKARLLKTRLLSHSFWSSAPMISGRF